MFVPRWRRVSGRPAVHTLLLLSPFLGRGSAGPAVTRVEPFEELPAVLQRLALSVLTSPARGLRFLHILQHPAAPVFSQSLVLGLSPASQEHVSSLLPHGSSSLWTLAFNKLSTQTPRRQEETPTPGKGQSVWLELRTGGRISSRTVARLGFRGGASLHCPLSLEAPEGCGAGQGEAGPWASLQPSPSPLAAWGRPWGRDGQRGGVSVSFWLHRL